MKKILLCALIAFSGFLNAQNQIKVMTFNIHAASDATIEDIANFIKQEKPDIVALQEVDFYTDRSKSSTLRPNNNNEDMLTSLAKYTKMQGMFFPAIDVHGGKFGIAVLSNLGFESTQSISLPYVTGTEKRVAALCTIELANQKTVSLLCAHLDMANQDNGMDQIKKINELGREAAHPIILAGDLNKRVGTTHINELETTWKLSSSNEFDHIAQLSTNKFNVVNIKVYTDNTLSDHLPIMVTYELN